MRCIDTGWVASTALLLDRLVGDEGTVLVDSKKLVGLQNGVVAGVGGRESVSP